jgi:hypothetical protein
MPSRSGNRHFGFSYPELDEHENILTEDLIVTLTTKQLDIDPT